MSASRSVAAARARRAGGGGNNNARNTLKASEMQNAQFTPQQSSINSEKKDPHSSKLSVSDAFALVTIRLGRVESILQKVDIANIVAKLETGEGASVSNNTFVKSLISRIEDLEASSTSGGSSGVSDEIVDELRDIIDKNEKEIITLKDTIFNMQSMLINVNQKLSSMEMPKRESKEDLSVASVAEELQSGPTFSNVSANETEKQDEEDVKIVYSDEKPVENIVVSPNDQVSLSESQPEPASESVVEE
jgi:preprotein translocase subunit SecA